MQRNATYAIYSSKCGPGALQDVASDNNFLIIGQKGSRFHDMNACKTSSLQANATNTWLVTTIN